ncbi:hypothetical protein yfred0001_14810 [Yersinia frederiksenii ATCC 33641]|nr:hypothetical protein yfred0001_14810 [Yersinia frederiksenii ATCC 33641]
MSVLSSIYYDGDIATKIIIGINARVSIFLKMNLIINR